ncbi:TIGR00341 family protein [Novosphingobium sp. BL-8A]|uniref:TIGR00341 family protein n=1 Tax=Novosphingobium sp. BL-8A TaxID=3127639 RepID=UPI003757A7C6
MSGDIKPTADAASEPAANRREAPAWLRILRVRLDRWRTRMAHAVLLPELTPDQAYDLRQTVRKEGELSNGYILMCTLAAGIAILGLLQSSTAVVIGAMLVSPLMSPIAALGIGFASLDGQRIREAARVVAIGAAIGIVTGLLLTLLSPIRNATPEILSRTEPTLLDLAVALLSGIAGGYATVTGKGGTAIGVAIATALMPPLTVVGYGIGVLQPMFALGALLLFFTNLAAITFSVALIARLSSAARPFGRVEWTPRYVAALVVAFLILATPLSMTLMQLSQEGRVRAAARSAILAIAGEGATIAQLDVQSTLFGEPSVKALVVTPAYVANAQGAAELRLQQALGEHVGLTLQQVLAADVQAQTRAMVDAAMERTAAGIAADVPPYNAIRTAIGLPTRSLWSDRAQRLVYLEPVALPGWSLADYRAVETRTSTATEGWTVRLVPPAQPTLTVWTGADAAGRPADAVSPDLALWALQRWGMANVTLSGDDPQALSAVARGFTDAGIAAQYRPPSEPPAAEGTPANRPAEDKPTAPLVTVQVYPASPTGQTPPTNEAGPTN